MVQTRFAQPSILRESEELLFAVNLERECILTSQINSSTLIGVLAYRRWSAYSAAAFSS